MWWYDAIRTASTWRSLSAVPKSLITDSSFDYSGKLVQSMGMPISVGTIASIP